VRDGLVARGFDATGQGFRGTHDAFLHAAILAWGFARPRFSP
jgi:hypothetical protein